MHICVESTPSRISVRRRFFSLPFSLFLPHIVSSHRFFSLLALGAPHRTRSIRPLFDFMKNAKLLLISTTKLMVGDGRRNEIVCISYLPLARTLAFWSIFASALWQIQTWIGFLIKRKRAIRRRLYSEHESDSESETVRMRKYFCYIHCTQYVLFRCIYTLNFSFFLPDEWARAALVIIYAKRIFLQFDTRTQFT